MRNTNTYRKGDYLIVDEESGLITYGSRVRKDFKGALVDKRYADHEQPQNFIRGKGDPYPLKDIHPLNHVVTASIFTPYYVGRTNVRTNTFGAAYHLFTIATASSS